MAPSLISSRTVRAWAPLVRRTSRRAATEQRELSFIALYRPAVPEHGGRLSTRLHGTPPPGGRSFHPSSYSMDDMEEIMQQREIPPILDSMMEEEGYGAYDYQPDLYEDDFEDGSSATPILPDEILAQEPVYEDEEVATPAAPQKKKPVAPPVVSATPAASPIPSKRPEFPPAASAMPTTAPSPVHSPFASIVEEDSATAPPSSKLVVEEETPSMPAPIPSSHTHAAHVVVDATTDDFFTQAATQGGGTSTELDDLRDRLLPELAADIFQQNNGQEFNINSPRQVSTMLFGEPGKSTNKDTLEAMAGAGNRMADLVIQYRTVKSKIKRLTKKAENTEKGTRVRSISHVVRPTDDPTAAVAEASEDPLLLVDASSYIFRAYFSMPPIHRWDGMPTGAVMGVCSMLNRLILNRILEGEQPRMILVFDSKGPSFRKDLYPEYKANRPEAPMDLIPQFDLIRQASAAYGIPVIEAPTFEADDVIATLAVQAQRDGLDVHILSGDKDLMQLITPRETAPYIHMIDPMSMSRVTYDEVLEKWGVGPEQLGDVLALAGDSADNVPGVPGIGPKTASILLNEYGTLEVVLEKADEIKQKSRREKLMAYADQARLSRTLVELVRTIPDNLMTLPEGLLTDWRMEPLNSDRIVAFYDEMGFKDIKRRFQNQLQRGTPHKPKPSRSNKREKVDIPSPEDFADVPF
jgi:5'-3' exonuclease